MQFSGRAEETGQTDKVRKKVKAQYCPGPDVARKNKVNATSAVDSAVGCGDAR